MKKLAITTGLGTLLLATSVAFAADPEAGRKKAESCLGCHGVEHYVNTYPTYHVPKLGGQHGAYIASALQAYKNQQRSHATMHANAASLSAEDIADIAAYFSSLK